MGEIQSLQPLVERLATEGCYELVLTTTSSTGLRIAKELYGGLATVGIFSIDFWPCSRLAWNRIRPDLVLLIDSELWPEHLANARRRSIPIAVVNGRLSDRSYKCYRCLPWLFRWQILHLTAILVSSAESALRFRKLGLAKEKIIHLGNLKCDRLPLTPLDSGERANLLLELGLPLLGEDGEPTPILFGCSTWPGEESFLLDVFSVLLARRPNWRLILTPRHGERRRELCQLLSSRRVTAHLRSAGAAENENHLVSVIDTTGELNRLIRLGTVAFLGKTLPPNAGSQSPIDAVAAGVPLVCGPNIGNFRDILQDLRQKGSVFVGSDRDAVAKELLALAENEGRRTTMATLGQSWLEKNAGVTGRICEKIRGWAFSKV